MKTCPVWSAGNHDRCVLFDGHESPHRNADGHGWPIHPTERPSELSDKAREVVSLIENGQIPLAVSALLAVIDERIDARLRSMVSEAQDEAALSQRKPGRALSLDEMFLAGVEHGRASIRDIDTFEGYLESVEAKLAKLLAAVRRHLGAGVNDDREYDTSREALAAAVAEIGGDDEKD